MITLIFNEIKKLLSRKKTIITTIVFAVLLGLIGFGVYKEYENMKKWSDPKFQAQNLEESIKHMKESKNDPNAPEEYKKNLDENIAQMEEQLKNLKAVAEGKEFDWKGDLKRRIDENERMLKEATMDPRYKGDIELRIQQDKYLLEHNIQPDDGPVPTIHAIKFLKNMFMILGTIFLAVGVSVFTSDMVSGECTPPTLKLLLTQPVSRGKVLLSKFIAVVTTSIILILLVELAAFVIMGLIFGFGNFNYPVLTGTRFEFDLNTVSQGGHPLKQIAGSAHMITMGSYIIRMFAMQILFIIAACAFAFMISTLFKSSMISVSLSIVSMIGVYILQQMPFLGKFNMFMFTSYSDVAKVLDNQISVAFNNPAVNTTFGIMVLLVWTVICYAISHVVFVKKDILI